ncbi:hypothetical protein LSAT2_004187, partial [Lamellibrachia satsuma]
MEVLHHPAIQLTFPSSTSAEDTDDGTDDDGNIKGGCLKRQSCRANMANRLKRDCHFRGKSDGRRSRNLFEEVISSMVYFLVRTDATTHPAVPAASPNSRPPGKHGNLPDCRLYKK